MSEKPRLSVFILTRNEELNLPDCLESLKGWCHDIHIVDSFSTDATLDIARRYGAQYLLVCPDMSETTVYRARSPNGFYAQLHRGQVPNWLDPVALPEKSPFRLWRIRYDLPDLTVSAPKAPPRR